MVSPPLHVWVLSAEYEPYIIGGLGVVATALTRELTQLGLKITVISSTPKETVSIDRGKKLTVVRFPERYNTKMMVKYLADHRISPPDVIHVHSLQYVDLQRHYKTQASIPVVYTCHSLVSRQINRVFTPARQAKLLRSADRVVVPSTAELEKLLERYPFCKGKSLAIGHGVKVGVHGDVASGHKYRLLYAGRLTRNKGLEELIDAMALLRTRYPQARLYVIGGGKLRARRLRQMARERGIGKIVHLLGQYDHERLQAAYREFGAVVMPSKEESFGLVALEALAAGVPLVATQAGGLGQFVSDEVAHVIERVDAPSIARAISQMWQNPSLTKQRAQAGRELALRYQWSDAARSYLQVFASLIQ